MSRTGSRRVSLVSKSSVLKAAYRDDFLTGSGAVNGRSYKGNNWITALDNTTAGNGAYGVTQPAVVTTGKGTLNGGSAGGNKSHAWRVPEAYDDYFVCKLGGVPIGNSIDICAHQQVDPSAQAATGGSIGTPVAFGGLKITTGTGNIGTINFIKTDGTNLTTANFGFVQYSVDGDTFEYRTVNSGAVDYLEVYSSGRRIGSSGTYYSAGRWNLTNMVAAGLAPLSGKHGFGGGNTGKIDWVEGGRPSYARLINQTFGRVVQAGATASPTIQATYTGAAPFPGSLVYDLRLASDNTLIGAAGQIPAKVVVDTTAKTIRLTINAFTPTAAFFVQIYESNGIAGPDGSANERRGDTPALYAGKIVVSQGQSNMGNADASVSTVVTIPVQQWLFSVGVAGSDSALWGYNTVASDSSGNASGGPTATTSYKIIGWYLSTIAPALSNVPVTYISAAVGGTAVAARAPGGSTGIFENTLATIQAMGGAVDHIRWADGESDLGTTQAAYKAAVYSIIDGYSAATGNTVPVMMEAMGTYPQNVSDVQSENMRRNQMFVMPSERPTQIIPAAFALDLQHTASFYLHYTVAAYAERTRRSAMALRKFKNSGTYPNDRLGPKMISARRVDATHIGVTFSLGDFTNMATSGMAYTTAKTDVYGGGVRFGTTVGTPSGAGYNTITSAFILPNGLPVVGTVSAGQVEVIWPFASVPATTYVGGPYGRVPFNPDCPVSGIDTIEEDVANKASMMLGTIAGETSVAIQPYWNVSGNDYLTAV